MQSGNRYLGDLAKMANGALSVAAGARQEMRHVVQQRFERLANEHGWVTREEFEAVRDMAVKARTTQDEMAARLADIEGALAALKTSPRKSTRARSKTEPGDGDTG